MGFKRLKKEEKQVIKNKYIKKYGQEDGRDMADFRTQMLESYMNIKTVNVANEE